MIRALVFALFLALVAGGWIASNQLKDDPKTAEVKKPPVELNRAENIHTVRTRSLSKGQFTDELKLSATTALASSVTISSEVNGRILKVNFDKGDRVTTGDLLASVETSAQDLGLEQAQTNLAQARTEFEARQKLVEKGFAAKNSLSAFETRVKQAETSLKQAELAADKLEIRASAAGKVEARLIEPGQLVNPGDAVVKLVSDEEIKFKAEASEREIAKLSLGDKTEALTISGEKFQGELTYIAAIANKATRTFGIEITAPSKPGQQVLEGMTAEVSFRLQPTNAHLIPNSALTLNEVGTIGIKLVEKGRTTFYPIDLLNATNQGVWVEGLSQDIELITVGQEFVRHGQAVNAVDENQIKAALDEAEQVLDATAKTETGDQGKPDQRPLEDGQS